MKLNEKKTQNMIFNFSKKFQFTTNMSVKRSILEQSAVVWHRGLTAKISRDLERVQKIAVKIILGKSYDNYSDGLKHLKLDSL
jgi:hypothetical protein